MLILSNALTNPAASCEECVRCSCSTGDQDRANAAVALAVSLLSEDAALVIFYIFEGTHLAKKDVAETIEARNFAPVRDLFPTLLEEDVPMSLCGACAKTYNITENDLVERVKIIHIPTIAAEMADRETLTFSYFSHVLSGHHE